MAAHRAVSLVDESDRGCILVGAAVLEEGIEDLFKAVFAGNNISKGLQRDLLGSNGPLSNFSGKIKLAYAMGLIGRDAFEDLESIRKLRNEFAHTSREVDLAQNEVKVAIEALHSAKPYLGQFKRFSPKAGGALDPPDERAAVKEARLIVAGYVKYAKSLFSLATTDLRITITRAQLRVEQGPMRS